MISTLCTLQLAKPLANISMQAVNMSAILCKYVRVKNFESRRWLKNGCDGNSVEKVLIATIQVNFELILSENGRSHLNCRYQDFLQLTYHHSHFLAATCISFPQLFSPWPFYIGLYLFYSLHDCLRVDRLIIARLQPRSTVLYLADHGSIN